ncbi:hypothetical protein ACY18M_17180, partial [Proteus mirabilis]
SVSHLGPCWLHSGPPGVALQRRDTAAGGGVLRLLGRAPAQPADDLDGRGPSRAERHPQGL